MKDKLYLILEEITELKSQIEGVSYILTILVEVYETNNQMNEFYVTQLFEKYNIFLQNELSKVVCEIDELILKI